jgi:phosphomevalonate kinase
VKARAPGKLVLSGAYAVLHGAPAIATAVDRYVLADSSRAAEFLTPEVEQVLGRERAPWFDASALRQAGKKLGLGSSAAILVASLAALELDARGPLAPAELSRRVLESARLGHRSAQGGGSGIDVFASVLGGTFRFDLGDGEPRVDALELPPGVVIEAFWSGNAASTPRLLEQVRALAARESATHDRLMGEQAAAALRAIDAVVTVDAVAFVAALDAQGRALAALGDAASAPIVPAEARALAELARAAGSTVLPAGAGGGDIVLHVGLAGSSPAFRERARELGHERLELGFGALGVHDAGASSRPG